MIIQFKINSAGAFASDGVGTEKRPVPRLWDIACYDMPMNLAANDTASMGPINIQIKFSEMSISRLKNF